LKLKVWIIVLFAVLLYCGSIGLRPLFSPDEVRYGEVAREMVVSGDWVTPHINGLLYFEKPAPGYWPIALSLKLFGEIPFAVRFPSALFSLLTGVLVLLWGVRSGRKELGAAAAGIYLTTGLVFGVGTFGVLDGTFTFFVLLGMLGFFFADTSCNWRSRLGWLLLAGIGIGGGFLVKGMLSPVLIGSAVFGYLLWQKHYRQIFLFPWIPLAVALAVVWPWASAIHRAQPEFWSTFLWVEHVQRAVSGQGANDDRSKPFWFYLPVLLGGSMPWGLLIPLTVGPIRRRAKEFFREPEVRLAAVSSGVWFLALSCVSAKLGTYVLPCFGGIAILLAGGLLAYRDEYDWHWFDRIWKGLASLLIGCTVCFFILHTCARFGLIRKSGFLLYRPHESILLPMLLGMVMASWYLAATLTDRPRVKFRAVLLGTALAMLGCHGAVPEVIWEAYAPEPFLKATALPLMDGRTRIYAEKNMATAACWTFKRTGIGIYARPGELRYGMERAGIVPLKEEEIPTLTGRGVSLLILTGSKRKAGAIPQPKVVFNGHKQFVVFCPAMGEPLPKPGTKR